MPPRSSILACVFLLTGLGVAVCGDTASRVFDALDAARERAGAPPLERRADLDAIAGERARRVAARPPGRRLADPEPVADALREGGIHFLRADERVALNRGYADPASAFRPWSSVLDPARTAIGLAVHTADDGWTVLVAIVIDDFEVPRDLDALERATVAAINDERQSRGLEPLLENPRLADVARGHSDDMARRGYFGHRSRDGRRIEDRARAGGVTFRKLGENLHKQRGSPTPVTTAVEGWLRSRGHRKTLLTPGFRETGVGVAVADDGSIYFTQLFLTPP